MNKMKGGFSSNTILVGTVKPPDRFPEKSHIESQTGGLKPSLGASQMTTKLLTIKFAKFPNFIVMEFPRKNSVLGQFSVNFPLPTPFQNANFINIVVSAPLKLTVCKLGAL